MSLITYYITHTIKNSIKKLFKSKGGIIVLLIFAFFISFGMLGSKNGSKNTAGQMTQIVQSAEKSHGEIVFGMAAVGLILILFFGEILTASSKGTRIFQMPDVNFLFAAPVRPQTILLFRILIQMGATLVGSIYMIFQFPNLMNGLHIGLGTAFGILAVYFFMLVICMLCSVLVYSIASRHSNTLKVLSWISAVALLGMAAYFGLLIRLRHLSMFEAGAQVLDGAWFRQVPVIGWLKGMLDGMLQNNTVWIVLYSMLNVLAMVVLILVIYRLPVDFYEDAVSGAQKTMETQNSAKEGRMVIRERSAKIQRNLGFTKGQGASMFYHKTIYNHKRFSKGRLFSGNGLLYLCVCVGIPCLSILIKTSLFTLFVTVILVMTFFLSMDSCIANEVVLNFLLLVPEPEWKKTGYCALVDLRIFLSDTLIPYAIGSAILRMNVLEAAAWYFLTVAFYYLANQFSAWVDLVLPTTVAPPLKVSIGLLLKMFTAVPALIVGIICCVQYGMTIGIFLAGIATVLTGALFMGLCPGLLRRGRS